jgi:hypothetical protein
LFPSTVIASAPPANKATKVMMVTVAARIRRQGFRSFGFLGLIT